LNLKNVIFLYTCFPKVLEEHRKILLEGRGFTLLRGFPIQKYPIEDQAAIFMGIGSYFGNRKPQNGKGHVLGHVKDLTYGSTTKQKYDPNEPTTRLYTTRLGQPFHTDGTDIVGLLCLQGSEFGGESMLNSSHALYNRINSIRPDIIYVMKQDWHWDKKGEHRPEESPLMEAPPLIYHKDKIIIAWSPPYFETVTRFGIKVAPEQFEAMKLVQEISKQQALKMRLEVGDMQFVHNHHVMHCRNEYRDSYEHTRHLLRLWLNVPEEIGGWDWQFMKRKGDVFFFNVKHTVPLEAE